MWGNLEHPNLLPFYGIYHLGDNYGRVCLVSLWMENGNICDYLEANPEAPRLPLVSIDSNTFYFREIVSHL